MHANGYLNQTRPNRAALTTTIALHALAVVGLFAYNPGIVGDVITYLPIDTITAAPPPPAPPIPRTDVRKPAPRAADPASAEPTRSTATSIAPTAPAWPGLAPLQPIELGNGSGVGVPIEAATPEPVLVAASLDLRATRDLQPPYPPALQRAEVEGAVTVTLKIGIDGRVVDITLVRADDPGFFAATRDWALRHWRFSPATRDGVPVVGSLTKTVRFVIDR